jgi:mediator of RNA polymerase II transcription subunit 5
MIAQRLELFRTQNLLPLEPVDKKAQAANDEIDQIIDSTLGIDVVPVVDLPAVNSRAGLYVYLHSLVSVPILCWGTLLMQLSARRTTSNR